MNIRFTQLAAVGAALFSQAACSSTSTRAPAARREPPPAPIAQADLLDPQLLRAAGPDGLARALVAYDAATGDDRAHLADLVDRVAGQRYATTSRLYWYTDLQAAQAAARAAGKPILSLRMLGRLDEDQSCANSRFFRVALYGNAALAAWLRANFVMHWSSERPVPKVSIDLGDGRRIDTTVAGNSAHYVLDADGQVLDVIPGLMTPRAFQHELAGALDLAGELASGTGGARLIERHHAGRLAAIGELWRGLGEISLPLAPGEMTLASAEQLTVTKMRIERPLVKYVKLGDDPRDVAADSPAWAQIGRAVLAKLRLEGFDDPILDEPSRALVASLAPTDWSNPGAALDEDGLAALVAEFEATIVADSGINLTRLREQIHTELMLRANPGTLDFASVNAWVYETVFLTPAQDPWLGLATPGTFTGLPRDGVSTTRRTGR